MRKKESTTPAQTSRRAYGRGVVFGSFLIFLLGLTLNTISFADANATTYGGAGGGSSQTDPSAGSGNGSGNSGNNSNNGKHIRWVYFRIKDGADEHIAKHYKNKNPWKVAGLDVSACSRTEGLYFSFEAFDNSDTLKNSQSTLPYNGYSCAKGCNWGCCARMWMYYTEHTTNKKPGIIPVDTSVYDANVFQPEYIVVGDQKLPEGGVAHKPKLTDLNENGEVEGRFIWYDKPNDVQLYILNEWENGIRLKWFEGNDYYYNPNDSKLSSRQGKYCKDPKGNTSWQACQILSYDPPNGITYGDDSHLSNYRAGNNGYVRGGSADPQKATNVNVSWFCSGEERVLEGSFSGSLSLGTPANTSKISGTTYLGSYDKESYAATAKGTITRTDSQKGISKLKAKGYFQSCTNTNTSTCSKINNSEFSGDLAINGAKEGTTSANTGTISVGGSATVCRRLIYMGNASIESGTQKDGSYKGTDVSCYTVYRPARATFSGTVANISSNNDNRIKDAKDTYLLGDGSSTSFNIKTSYTLKRTNNNPASAKSKYTTSYDSQPDSADTLSNNLADTKTQNITANNAKTVSQSVGTKGSHCFYMTYENSIDYYNSGSNRIDNRNSIDKINKCATLYNPTYADVSNKIEYSVVGMTGNATDGFRGNGYNTTYTVTVHYLLSRTDSRKPDAATARFGVNAGVESSFNNNGFPSTLNKEATGLKNGAKTYDYPVSFDISFKDREKVTVCSYIKYDNKIGYIEDGGLKILESPFDTRSQSTNYQCVNFTNPRGVTATFSAQITSENGSYLSGDKNVNGSTNERAGNGLYGQYTITPTYTIKRTNNVPPISVTSRYAWSDASQPTSHSDSTSALSYGKTYSFSKAKTVAVDIGGTNTQCFYISYDNKILLTDISESRTFDGKQFICYKFTNPAQSYVAHYDGSSTGTIDPHANLYRYDNNHAGLLENAVRVSGTNTDADGSYVDNFPTKANGTPDDKYTVTFNHMIWRTDEDKSATSSTKYFVTNTAYHWEIQDCEDAACDAGIYSKYSASKDTDSSRTTSSTKDKLSVSTTNQIETQAKFTFNSSNKGKYLKYCQRVAYSKSAKYTSATDPKNRNGHSDSLDNSSVKTPAYSTPACVIIRNPNWSEAVSATKTHYIDVSGLPSGIYPSGAKLISGNQYETTVINPSFLFDNTVTRYDNTKWRKTNFDESDIKSANEKYYSNNPSTGRAFFQPSIYGNSNYSVHAPKEGNKNDLKMYGSETLPGTRDTVKLINPLKMQVGSLVEIDGRDLVLNAKDKDHGDNWTSTANDGRTRVTFNGMDRAALNKNNSKEKDLADHSIMAGDTKNFTIGTYNARAAWSVGYKEITRQEVYPGSWKANASGSRIYNRTEKTDSAPRLATPTVRDSRTTDTTSTYSIYRPYNYIISDIYNSNVDSIALAGDTYAIDYTITVDKENEAHEYITDPNQVSDGRFVYVVAYTVDSHVTPDQLRNLTPAHSPGNGDYSYTGNPVSDLCGVVNRSSFVLDCQILTDGQPTKLSKKEGQTADPGTSFKHVYDLNNYQMAYTTGPITVPELNVGEKYCVAIAVRNYSSASSSYFVSTSSCRNISKRPALQVWGSSVMSNGGVITTTSMKDGLTFGSWADYAITANGNIKQMASGANYINGANISASTCHERPNPLTISNAYCNQASDKYLGRARVNARIGAIERFQEYLASNTTLGEIPQVCNASGCRYIADNGKDYIINTTNDITIDKNIINNQTGAQVVIVARNIKIDQSVTHIDAMLIATGSDGQGGTIDTCGNSAVDALSSMACTNRLTINGTVIAKNVLLKRTAGGDPIDSIREPAELINSRTTLYLWSYNKSTENRSPRVVYSRELPPRY